jgi:hypothetical protein
MVINLDPMKEPLGTIGLKKRGAGAIGDSRAKVEKVKPIIDVRSKPAENGVISVGSSGAMWCIDPLLGKDLETNNEFSRCYAIIESTNGRF